MSRADKYGKNEQRWMTPAEQYRYKKACRMQARARQIKAAKVRISVAIVFTFVAFSILAGGIKNNANASEAGIKSRTCYTNITVSRGDTLWAIADRYTDGDNSRTAELVSEIRYLNNLNRYEAICPGDKLIVPYTVYEE